MTTISQIISDAYREANLTAIGTSPTDAENTEALRLLNRFIPSLFGNEMGEPLDTIALGRGNIKTPDNVQLYMDDLLAYYVPENTRLHANLTSPVSINLCPQPKDGSRFALIDESGNLSTYNVTVYANGRNIEGTTSVVLDTNSLVREWFYREDLGQWARLTVLDLSSNSPFPIEFDDLLILGLSLRINPRQGISLDPQSQAYMMDIRKKFKNRYRQFQEVPSEQGLIRLPGNKAIRGTMNSSRNFARGTPQW